MDNKWITHRQALLDVAETSARQLAHDLTRWEHETTTHRATGHICGCQGCILVATLVPDPGQPPTHPAHPNVLLANIDTQRALLARLNAAEQRAMELEDECGRLGRGDER